MWATNRSRLSLLVYRARGFFTHSVSRVSPVAISGKGAEVMPLTSSIASAIACNVSTTFSNRCFVLRWNGIPVIMPATLVAMVPAYFDASAKMLLRLLFRRIVAFSIISSRSLTRILSGKSMVAIRLKISWLDEAGRLPHSTAR